MTQFVEVLPQLRQEHTYPTFYKVNIMRSAVRAT